MKKYHIYITILALGIFLGVTPVSAGAHKSNYITPYGVFCSHTSHYGMHRGTLDNSQVQDALKHYYRGKGLNVEIVTLEGRFIKALVKDNEIVVDTVIIDRKSGRIRSIN